MSSVWKIILFSIVAGLTVFGAVKLENWEDKRDSRNWLIKHRDRMSRELMAIFRGYEGTAPQREWVIVGIRHNHESSGGFWDASSPDKRPTEIDAASILGLDCMVAYGGHIQGGNVVEWFDITPVV